MLSVYSCQNQREMIRRESRVLMDVYLNIYDFLKSNKYWRWIGLDVYHTAVEIGGIEYCYFVTDTNPETTGIISISPEDCGLELVEKIYMGETYVQLEHFQRMLDIYQKKYTCGDYNIFSHNCNHFTNEFLLETVGKRLPDKIFKTTNCLKICCGCLPKKWLNGQWSLEKLLEKEKRKEQEIKYQVLNDEIGQEK